MMPVPFWSASTLNLSGNFSIPNIVNHVHVFFFESENEL